MNRIEKQWEGFARRWKCFAAAITVAAGMTGFSFSAQAYVHLDKEAHKPGIENSGQAAADSTDTNIRYRSIYGLSTSTVKSVQRKLEQQDLYQGRIDGRLNDRTEAAIRQFQRDISVTPTGLLDQATLNSLGVWLSD
jgi:peptidoglycan hydrolase-like protein with peptidoglycan-binding domain